MPAMQCVLYLALALPRGCQREQSERNAIRHWPGAGGEALSCHGQKAMKPRQRRRVTMACCRQGEGEAATSCPSYHGQHHWLRGAQVLVMVLVTLQGNTLPGNKGQNERAASLSMRARASVEQLATYRLLHRPRQFHEGLHGCILGAHNQRLLH